MQCEEGACGGDGDGIVGYCSGGEGGTDVGGGGGGGAADGGGSAGGSAGDGADAGSGGGVEGGCHVVLSECTSVFYSVAFRTYIRCLGVVVLIGRKRVCAVRASIHCMCWHAN